MNIEKLFHIHKYGDNWMNEYQKTVDLRHFKKGMEDAIESQNRGGRPDMVLISKAELDAYKKAVKNGRS